MNFCFLVLLESDVQAAFPYAEALNEALRMLIKKSHIVKFKTGLNANDKMPNKLFEVMVKPHPSHIKNIMRN